MSTEPADTVTPAELADMLGIHPKTCRAFLRSDASGVADQAPGQGGRWAIPRAMVPTLLERYRQSRSR